MPAPPQDAVSTPLLDVLGPGAFQRLAELSPDGMLAHRGGRVVWANRAAALKVGLHEASELVGRSVLDFVRFDEREDLAADIQHSAVTHEARVYRRTFLRNAGEPFEAEIHRVPLGNGLMLVVMRDLEAGLKAERQQHSAELRARAFFDATTEAMGISKRGVHVDANQAYAALFGYDDPKALAGLPIFDLLDPSEHQRVREVIAGRGRGESPPSYTVWALRRDGTRFLMEVKASSYLDGSEVVSVVVVRDVTAEQAEEARLRHREKLEAIGRLAGGIAHDFNNILAGILGSAELSLPLVPTDSEVHGNLVTITEATHRARDLVRQILTFGRRDKLEPRPLALGQVVLEAVGLARVAIPPTVVVESRIAPLEGSLVADATQVQRVVLNLCANARDAVGASGHVEVSVEPAAFGPGTPALGPGRWARLRIQDDGEGMDEPTRARLFEPYHTTKAERGGHGLGLAVVHGIVSDLGGHIQVASAPGQGTTFEVYLPLSEQATVAPPRVTPAGGGSEHLLVVDDEPMLRLSVSRLLGALGYRVSVAVDGVEALALLRAAPGSVDLVLSDISMPRLSGLELAKTLLAEQPGARILLCTGFTDALGEAEAQALGVKAVLAKPLTKAELAAAVRAALASR